MHKLIEFIKHQYESAEKKNIELSSEVLSRLDRICQKLDHMEKIIMAAIDDLQAAVAAEDTVIDSAVVLLNGIPGLIAAAGTDPAKLAALQADITAKTTALSAAVLAGTPTPNPSAPPVTPAAATTAAAAANA